MWVIVNHRGECWAAMRVLKESLSLRLSQFVALGSLGTIYQAIVFQEQSKAETYISDHSHLAGCSAVSWEEFSKGQHGSG